MLDGGERKRSGFFGACPIARGERDAIEGQGTFRNLQPGAATLLEFVRHRLAGLEPDAIDVRVLVDRR